MDPVHQRISEVYMTGPLFNCSKRKAVQQQTPEMFRAWWPHLLQCSFTRRMSTNHTNDRVINIDGDITEDIARGVIRELLKLDKQSNEMIRCLFSNSEGGCFIGALAIYDIIQYIRSPVNTVCIGKTGLLASLLLAAGSPDLRMASSDSRIILTGMRIAYIEASADELMVNANEYMRVNELMINIFVRHIKQHPSVIENLIKDADLSPQEAFDNGIIDVIVSIPT